MKLLHVSLFVITILALAVHGRVHRLQHTLSAKTEVRDFNTFKGTCPAADGHEDLFTAVNGVEAVTAGADTTAVCKAITAAKDRTRTGTHFTPKDVTVGLEIEIGWGRVQKSGLDYDDPVAADGSKAMLRTDGCTDGTCFFEWKTTPLKIEEIQQAHIAATAIVSQDVLDKTSLADVVAAYNRKLRHAPTSKVGDVVGGITYTYNKDGKPPSTQTNFAFPLKKLIDPCLGKQLSRSTNKYHEHVHGTIRKYVGTLALPDDDDLKGLVMHALLTNYANAMVALRTKKNPGLGAGMGKSQNEPLWKTSAADALRMMDKKSQLKWWRFAFKKNTGDGLATTWATGLSGKFEEISPKPADVIYYKEEQGVKFKDQLEKHLKSWFQAMKPQSKFSGRYPGETNDWYGTHVAYGKIKNKNDKICTWYNGVSAGKPVAPQMCDANTVCLVAESRNLETSLNRRFDPMVGDGKVSTDPASYFSAFNVIRKCAGFEEKTPPPLQVTCDACTKEHTGLAKWKFDGCAKGCREYKQKMANDAGNKERHMSDLKRAMTHCATKCYCYHDEGKLCKEPE